MEIFEFKIFHFSKWLTPQIKTFVLRKRTVQIGQKCVDSLSKRLIYISIIEIQVQIGLLLEISEAGTFCRSKNAIKWGFTFNHHNHQNGATIDVCLNGFVQA